MRRRLYEVVTRQAGPVGRDEAASAAGRALAVYHLDKLVESGLLTAFYQRPAGRSVPGAGRPAKLYARAEREFTVTVPPREYELAARLLVQVVESDPSGRSGTALREAAHRLGTDLGSRFRLDEARDGPPGREERAGAAGIRAERGDDGVIRLRNCPFHRLVERHRDVVCGMNLALVEGLVAGLEANGWHPALDPRPGHCCVAIDGDRP